MQLAPLRVAPALAVLALCGAVACRADLLPEAAAEDTDAVPGDAVDGTIAAPDADAADAALADFAPDPGTPETAAGDASETATAPDLPDTADAPPETADVADGESDAPDTTKDTDTADVADAAEVVAAAPEVDTAEVDTSAPPEVADIANVPPETVDAVETDPDGDVAEETDSVAQPDLPSIADTAETAPVTPDTSDIGTDAAVDAAPDACATLTCNDNNPCTTDGCAAGACTHTPAEGPCDDGNACTTEDACAASSCAAGTPKVCDDGKPCTADGCDKAKGCVALPTSATCTDDNACTDGDACKDGNCAAGATKMCDDGNACTADSCLPKTGCTTLTMPASVTCTMADSCGGVCEVGTCVAVPDKVFSKVLPNTADDYGRDVLAVADGLLWAATTSTNTKGGFDGWLYRTDPVGKLLWEQKYGGASNDWLHRAVANKDGFVFIGTTQSKGAGNSDVWFVRTDSKGAVLAEKTYGGTQADEGLAVVPFAPTAGWLVFGRYKSYSNGIVYQARVEITDSYGNYQSSLMLSESAEGDVEPHFATVSGNTVFLAGTTKLGAAPTTAWLRALTLDNPPKPIWKISLGPFGAEQELALTAAQGGGGVVAMTGAQQGLGGQVRVVRVDGNGAVVWDKLLGGANAELPRAVVQAGSGFVLAGATTTDSAGGWDGWLVRLTGDGDVAWSATLGSAAEDMPHGLAMVPGGIALVGHATKSGNKDLWQVRTDVWGHASCKAAGKCLELAEAACEDSNGCTLDGCDAIKGCTKAPTAEGLACTATDACSAATCKAGSCQGTASKLFDQQLPNFDARAMAVTATGYLVGGMTTDAQAVACQRFGWDGKALAPVVKLDNYMAGPAVAISGGLALTNYYGHVYRVDDSGKVLWKYTGGEIQNAVAIASMAGGDLAVATANSCSSSYYRLHRIDGTGKLVTPLSWSCSPLFAQAMATAADAVYVIGYDSNTSVGVHRWPLDGTNQSYKPGATAYFPGGGQYNVYAAAADLQGVFWVGRAYHPSWKQPEVGWVMYWNPKSTTPQPFDQMSLAVNAWQAIALTATGPVIAGKSPGNQVVVAGLSPQGMVAWQRTLGQFSYPTNRVAQFRPVSDGFEVLLGNSAWANGYSSMLRRSDPWGFTSCANSGKCFATPLANCDDNNPCTADTCAVGKCSGVAVADKTPCGANTFCKAAKCVAKTASCADQNTAAFLGDGGFGWTLCAPDYPKWGAGPDSPNGLKDNGDGTVSDSLTGLQWVKASNSAGFAQAEAQCAQMTTGGKTDWRLPTRTELRSLVDYTKAAPPFAPAAAGVSGYGYWSATPVAGTPANHWTVDFSDGGGKHYDVNANVGVKCVRIP